MMGNEPSKLAAIREESARDTEVRLQEHSEIERQKRGEVVRPMNEDRSSRENLSPSLESARSSSYGSGGVSQSDGERGRMIRPADSSAAGSSDLLKSFGARKERPMKSKKAQRDDRSGEDKIISTDNEALPQHDKKRKVPPMLDTQLASDRAKARELARSHSASISPASATASRGYPGRPGEGRKPSLQGLPKIQKRTPVASPQQPNRSEDGQQAGSERQQPQWYKETPYINKRDKNDGGVDILLSTLRSLISKCNNSKASLRNDELQKAFMDIRTRLHKIKFQEVNGKVLKKNFMLHNADGLPQLFDEHYNKGCKWPYDIRADAKEQYNKWYRQVFSTDIMRGIKFQVTAKGSKREGGDSIDKEYQPYVVSAKFHGSGDLINGQWWPFQICAYRDGAHGIVQGGIYGVPGEGAYSCILSGGNDSTGKPYPDEDYGDVVQYCGTDSEDGNVTAYTQRMLESVNGEPVRLMRSHNLHSDFAPEFGFRYDGLYEVQSFERLDPEKSQRQRHRFELVRLKDQDPIRGGSGPEKRPTAQEIDEYKKHQRLSGKGVSKA